MNQHYKAAGVDVEAGYRAVDLMKHAVQSTYTPGVMGDLGGFGGMFAPDLTGMRRPILVSGTDGVGTKLKVAFRLGKHDTVGVDCVAMCANDILCAGAKPLFFLDYIAVHKVVPEQIAEIVGGIAEGCRQAGAALIGGETAEMGDFYPVGEYDIAGFCVGIMDETEKIDGSTIRPGDVIVGLPSGGVHSNGFSLYRKLFADAGDDVWAELLTPTRIYAADIAALRKRVTAKGIAHITGGGWIENIPRMLPAGVRAVMNTTAMPVPDIFARIAREGDIPQEEMYNIANMGLGMAVCLAKEDADAVGLPVVGKIEEGTGISLEF